MESKAEAGFQGSPSDSAIRLSCSRSRIYLESPTSLWNCTLLHWIVRKLELKLRGGEQSLSGDEEEEMCGEPRRCLCDTVYPILRIAQLSGLLPLRLQHEKEGLDGDRRRTGSCRILFKWRALGPLANTFFLLAFLLVSPLAYQQIRSRMDQIFNGTDMYAFTFQTLGMFLQTLILLVAGRVNKDKFSKGWAALTEVYHALCDSADDLCRIKMGAYAALLIVVLEGGSYFAFNMWITASSIGFFQGPSCLAIYVGTLYLQLSTFIPYVFSALFFFVCLLLRTHFLKISEMLRTVVGKTGATKLGARIDSLRVLHEQLCQAVSYFEDFFGVQVLVTLCLGCFTIITGAYACILQGEGISSAQGQEMGAWATQLYCAAVFIFLILIGGQMVTNAAGSAAKVLNVIPLSDLDEKSQAQIGAFLNKVSAFPTTMSAVNITRISTTFLATAATNITTYLLVLMQFKLSVEQNRLPDQNYTIICSELGLSPVGLNATMEAYAD